MLKTILVHLDGTASDDGRLNAAASVARRFDAHLTGLLVSTLPEPQVLSEGAAAYFADAYESSRADAVVAADRLRQTMSALDIRFDLRTVECQAGANGQVLSDAARLADLFVGTRPDQEWSRFAAAEEQVLFRAGRACLLVPPGQPETMRLDTAMVAWNNTREAARAMAEAIPLLASAQRVIVAMVENGTTPARDSVELGADVGRYLSRHGVSVEARRITGFRDVGEALLNEIDMTATQLLVMGAFGHSRFREWVLGGATRTVLQHARIPVLMAH
ncbi:universal stress protein [Devosia sp. SL43]|uniref:universal stress protein n=1 Tax=Devosia sp. SL43 TaxID=2806348 RepID=UPI001F22AE44|nr:universal stress protein [Devosia sp. SL43]UJW85573.1 universal stress protein [Devosia sp. SL43]